MTITATATADATLAELADHLFRIQRLEREPFTAERVAAHRAMALECLDALADAITGEVVE